MAYDSYKKTKKIDMKNIKRRSQESRLKGSRINVIAHNAGIPNDLAVNNNEDAAEFNQIRSLFKSTQDMKKLRDILNVMINKAEGGKRDSRLKGAARLDINAQDDVKDNIFGQANIKTNRQ